LWNIICHHISSKPIQAAKPSASVQTAEATMVHGMCGQWQAQKQCIHLESGKCNRKHDPNWLPVPETACRNWFFKRSCKFGDQCRFKHTTLEELRKAQGGSPAVAAAGAASSKQSSTGKHGAGAAAATASAIAPTTPRKESGKRSSLESLASPAASSSFSLARTQSTPIGSHNSSAKKKLALVTKPKASASSAAVASDPDAAAAETEEDPPC